MNLSEAIARTECKLNMAIQQVHTDSGLPAFLFVKLLKGIIGEYEQVSTFEMLSDMDKVEEEKEGEKDC